MAFNIIISRQLPSSLPRYTTFARKFGRWFDMPLSSKLFMKRFRQNRHGKRMTLGAQVLANHLDTYRKTYARRRPRRDHQ